MGLDETAKPETRNNLTTKSSLGRSGVQQVEIVNFDIPFINLVFLLVKLAVAAIPAAIIVGMIWTIVGSFMFGIWTHTF